MKPAYEPLQIADVRDLPALPAAVLELLDMLGRDDVEISEIVARISLDQALTAKTLRLANSSFYGMPRHVASVTDATAVLGLRTVRAVVTAAVLTGSFKPPACRGFDFMAFWRHAVNIAVIARLVAAEAGADTDAAFTAGLLHDVGQLVLASAYPERFAEVLAHRAEAETTLHDAELALLGIDHGAVGGLVAEHWRFPQPIVEAIGHHQAPPAHAPALALVRIVHVADQLACGLERGTPAADAASVTGHSAWADLGLPAEVAVRILAEAELQTQTLCAALLT